jgi:hypothetical protein
MYRNHSRFFRYCYDNKPVAFLIVAFINLNNSGS